jgi:DNA-3-methyladenine glycosylase
MENGTNSRGIFPVFLDEDATNVAQRLLGCYLVRDTGEHIVRAMIVETESYDQLDAASHSFNGQTSRTDVMFGPSGHLYVYFTYGMHYCCNVVTGALGEGAAVLIRGVMPVEGLGYMEKRRGKSGYDVTNGPAKLCQALGIDKALNGHDLRYAPLRLETGVPVAASDIICTPRIGISKEREALRRFYIRDNPYVSRGIIEP